MLIARPRLAALLASAKNHRIAIVGDAMLDVYLTGDVDRVSPEAPVPVVRVRDRRHAPGRRRQCVAQNVAALGARAGLVATVGSDESAKLLKSLLKAQRGDTSGLVAVDRPTTTKTRIVARAQQVVRVDEETDDDCSPSEIAKLNAAVRRAVVASDALILEDYNKGVLVAPVIEHALAAARKKGIPVVVDPKYRNFFSYKGATVFKPNRRELEAALGAAVDVDHPKTLPGLVEKLGVDAILLTLSERGMALIGERGDGQEGRASHSDHRTRCVRRGRRGGHGHGVSRRDARRRRDGARSRGDRELRCRRGGRETRCGDGYSRRGARRIRCVGHFLALDPLRLIWHETAIARRRRHARGKHRIAAQSTRRRRRTGRQNRRRRA